MNKGIFLDYENKWVVTNKNYQEVLLSDSSLEHLQKGIRKLKIKNAVIMLIPLLDASIAPYTNTEI